MEKKKKSGSFGVFFCGVTLAIQYPQDFRFNETVALVMQTAAWKYDQRSKETKEKAPQAFFKRELSKI